MLVNQFRQEALPLMRAMASKKFCSLKIMDKIGQRQDWAKTLDVSHLESGALNLRQNKKGHWT